MSGDAPSIIRLVREAVFTGYPLTRKLPYPALTSSVEGRIMRRREAGRDAAPAGLVATRHPGGIGAPPGTTRSPRQELADTLRRSLIRSSAAESGARCRKTPQLARRKAPACRKARHHRFALFGAPPPHAGDGNRHKPDANARRGKENLCLHPLHPFRHATCAEQPSRKIAAGSHLPTGERGSSKAVPRVPILSPLGRGR